MQLGARAGAPAAGLLLLAGLGGAACGGDSTGPTPARYTVGGTVSGLGVAKSVVLQNNGGDDHTVSANGPFTFATALRNGAAYAVTVKTHPAGQSCALRNASGTISGADVTSVAVSCADVNPALDPTFGPAAAGFVSHGNAAGGDGDDVGQAVTTDAAGRLIVTGHSADPFGTLSMALWRYNPDGTLDLSFNGTGFTSHPGGGPGGNSETIGTAVATDGSGRIVVAGYSIGTDNLWGVAVWRYNPNGTPDPTFNGTGFVRLTTPRQGGGVGLALDSSGRIVVAGFTYDPNSIPAFNIDMTLWRFKPDGSLDSTFNATGIVIDNSAAGGGGEDIAVGVAVDASGKLVVTGYSTNAAGDQDLALWRYHSDGTPDQGFNGTGVALWDNPAGGGTRNDVGRDIAFDPSGRIVVTGWSPGAGTDDDLAIWRFTSAGALDASFNGTGVVTHNGAAGGSARDEGRAVVIDSDGRIVVTGSSVNADGDGDMVVWRYTAAGALDPTFAAGGILALGGSAQGTNGADGGRDLTLDSAGRVVVAGFSTNPAGNRDLGVWRLKP